VRTMDWDQRRRPAIRRRTGAFRIGWHLAALAWIACAGTAATVSTQSAAPAAQGRQTDTSLTVDKGQITLGEEVGVTWTVGPDAKNLYVSSPHDGKFVPSHRPKGTLLVRPKTSGPIYLLGETADGVFVKSAYVLVAGTRGGGAQLNPDDLSCKVTLPVTKALPLTLLVGVRTALESKMFSVEHEFVRGTDFVLQTKPGQPAAAAADASSARQVIHQVALGLNLAGPSAGPGGIIAMPLGSQLRFRRLQEAEWQVDTDATRCLDEIKTVKQAVSALLPSK
jgi:hypothetical protein